MAGITKSCCFSQMYEFRPNVADDKYMYSNLYAGARIFRVIAGFEGNKFSSPQQAFDAIGQGNLDATAFPALTKAQVLKIIHGYAGLWANGYMTFGSSFTPIPDPDQPPPDEPPKTQTLNGNSAIYFSGKGILTIDSFEKRLNAANNTYSLYNNNGETDERYGSYFENGSYSITAQTLGNSIEFLNKRMQSVDPITTSIANSPPFKNYSFTVSSSTESTATGSATSNINGTFCVASIFRSGENSASAVEDYYVSILVSPLIIEVNDSYYVILTLTNGSSSWDTLGDTSSLIFYTPKYTQGNSGGSEDENFGESQIWIDNYGALTVRTLTKTNYTSPDPDSARGSATVSFGLTLGIELFEKEDFSDRYNYPTKK